MNFVPVYLTIDTLKTDLIKKKRRGWKIDYRLNDSIYFLVTETNPYGTLFFANESTEEYKLVPPDTKSSKDLQKVGILIHHLLLELFMKKEVGLTHSSVM